MNAHGRPANLSEICSACIEDRLYGLPIARVIEIIGSADPQKIPLAPAFVGGLMHYRGDVLTAVSLRKVLCLPDREGPQDLLVVEGADGPFGLLVDKVGEVLTVSGADYEPTPTNFREHAHALFAGAYKLSDRLLVMLDTDCLEPMRLAAAS